MEEKKKRCEEARKRKRAGRKRKGRKRTKVLRVLASDDLVDIRGSFRGEEAVLAGVDGELVREVEELLGSERIDAEDSGVVLDLIVEAKVVRVIAQVLPQLLG